MAISLTKPRPIEYTLEHITEEYVPEQNNSKSETMSELLVVKPTKVIEEEPQSNSEVETLTEADKARDSLNQIAVQMDRFYEIATNNAKELATCCIDDRSHIDFMGYYIFESGAFYRMLDGYKEYKKRQHKESLNKFIHSYGLPLILFVTCAILEMIFMSIYCFS